MNVRIFCGAHAYACIEHAGQKTDIRLEPGRAPGRSLREYAARERGRAARILAMAELAETAAEKLEFMH